MNIIESLIKEAYKSLKSKKLAGKPVWHPSEEDMACYNAGLLSDREKKKVLNYIVSHDKDEESLRHSFLLGPDLSGRKAEDAPESLVRKAKQLVPSTMDENALDAVVEFAGNIARVIRTTGTILTGAAEGKLAPAAAFRDTDAQAECREIELSKAVNNHIIDVKITRIKKGLANLTVYIKNKKSGKPSSEERISLVSEDRELRSSLTDMGKVEFDNIKLKDYKINLIRKGEPYCVVILSLRALE